MRTSPKPSYEDVRWVGGPLDGARNIVRTPLRYWCGPDPSNLPNGLLWYGLGYGSQGLSYMYIGTEKPPAA